jgi:hypothetical protein
MAANAIQTARAVLIFDFAPAAAVGAGLTVTADVTLARGFDLIDAHVLAIATVAGSTATLSHQALGTGGFTTCSTALAMATDGTVIRQVAGGMTAAQRVFVSTDVMRCSFVDGGAGGANGHCYATVLPNAITGAS